MSLSLDHQAVLTKAQLKEARKDARKEALLKRSAEVYKRCLEIDSTLRILCDLSYIECLHSLNADPSGIDDIHARITRIFGVKKLYLVITCCVIEDINKNVEEAVQKDDNWKAGGAKKWLEEDSEGWGDSAYMHMEKRSKELEESVEYWQSVKKYASSFTVCCDHAAAGKIDPRQCLRRFFQNQLLDPFLLGTGYRRCGDKIRRLCGVPAVWGRDSGRFTVYPEKIKGYHKQQLEKFHLKIIGARKELEKEKIRQMEIEKVLNKHVQAITEAIEAVKSKGVAEKNKMSLIDFIQQVHNQVVQEEAPALKEEEEGINGGAGREGSIKRKRKRNHGRKRYLKEEEEDEHNGEGGKGKKKRNVGKKQ